MKTPLVLTSEEHAILSLFFTQMALDQFRMTPKYFQAADIGTAARLAKKVNLEVAAMASKGPQHATEVLRRILAKLEAA
jgi:hypothetical protein